MATREIKATLALDGEQKFNSQIKAAQRNLRGMRTELKAETAAFEANGDAMSANEARLKSLHEQQEQQQVIVKALEKALEEAKQKYGENSSQVDNYRMRLANARAEMANLVSAENKIIQSNAATTKSFAELKKEVADNWNDVATQVGGALKNVATLAAGAFTAVTAAAVSAGKTVVDWTVDAGHQADDLLTQSTITGIDTDTLQQWQYASNLIDTNVDTITGSIKKLRKNMGNNSEDMAEAFKFFGVRIMDSAGAYRDAADVFWDIIDRVSTDHVTFGNETETDNMLQKVLGNGYDQLLPLITSGRNAWEALGKEAVSKDLIMDEETLAAFGNFDDTLNKINADFQAIRNSIAAEFLPGTQEAADAVEELLATFNKFVNGDATAADVAKAAEETVQAVINALEHGIEVANSVIDGLKASDDPNVRAIGEMLEGIKNAGVALWENKDKIIAAAEGIAAIWVGSKIAGAINNITKFGSSVASLVSSMINLIAQAGAYGTAMETIGNAGKKLTSNGSGETGKNILDGLEKAAILKSIADIAGLTALATTASAASIAAGFASNAAAESVKDSVYRTTEGTEKEKQQAASAAYQEVLTPGTIGSWEFAKWIYGAMDSKMDDIAAESIKQYIKPMEQAADDTKETSKAANSHYVAATKSVDDVKGTVYTIGHSVEETMADLESFVNLSNWKNAIERGDVQSNRSEYSGLLDEIEAINKKYGGDILGNTEQGKTYLGVIQSMGVSGLDELPSVDAVFKLQPAEGTEDEMQQFVDSVDLLNDHLEILPEADTEWDLQDFADSLDLSAPLTLVPTVAAGFNAGEFRSALGTLSGGGLTSAISGTANVNINLDSKTIGTAVAPIVNQTLGSKIARALGK